MLHRARYMDSLATSPFRRPQDVLAALPDSIDAHFVVVKSLAFADEAVEVRPRFLEASDSRYLLYAARRVDRNDYVVCCVTKALLFSSVIARYNIESAYAPRLSIELLNANLRLVLPLNRVSVSPSAGGGETAETTAATASSAASVSDPYDRRHIAIDNLEQQVGSFEANRRNVLVGFTRSFYDERRAFVAACRERGVHRSRELLQSLQTNPPTRSLRAADKLLLLGNAVVAGAAATESSPTLSLSPSSLSSSPSSSSTTATRQDGGSLDDNPETPMLFSLSTTGPEKMLTLYAVDTAIVRLL